MDIPRVPLRHDRAVIAAHVLTAWLRTARRTGRPGNRQRRAATRRVLSKDANQRAHQAADSASSAQDVPDAHQDKPRAPP
ncbi:hypothetical protein JIX56_45930 [Streptomyces sp. CA-210063]|uniref:hypothetical protein n=1 Tax=Streptomyces sp. CA-210063 TaxID=2801029 RepID=UPI00214C4DEA|nr:hypothetical protein [Streptomyces sp. CA-210063]UUU36572.1 hypothetical protein JIX56_45930 [Streptomyces sp. CA-210063]